MQRRRADFGILVVTIEGSRLGKLESPPYTILFLVKAFLAQVLVNHVPIHYFGVACCGQILMAFLTMHDVPLMT